MEAGRTAENVPKTGKDQKNGIFSIVCGLRRCALVVGGGWIAMRRVRTLLEFGQRSPLYLRQEECGSQRKKDMMRRDLKVWEGGES